MDQIVSERPTSGASTAELAAQLHEVRARTHRLADDLSSEQLMGLKLDIVNPVLWEIGHVGWFHEYWTLRHVHGISGATDLGNRRTVLVLDVGALMDEVINPERRAEFL